MTGADVGGARPRKSRAGNEKKKGQISKVIRFDPVSPSFRGMADSSIRPRGGGDGPSLACHPGGGDNCPASRERTAAMIRHALSPRWLIGPAAHLQGVGIARGSSASHSPSFSEPHSPSGGQSSSANRSPSGSSASGTSGNKSQSSYPNASSAAGSSNKNQSGTPTGGAAASSAYSNKNQSGAPTGGPLPAPLTPTRVSRPSPTMAPAPRARRTPTGTTRRFPTAARGRRRGRRGELCQQQ